MLTNIVSDITSSLSMVHLKKKLKIGKKDPFLYLFNFGGIHH